MEYANTKANDGATLAYQSSINAGRSGGVDPSTCLLLLHGFSGSSEYFKRNVDALAKDHWIIAPDMRGHGRSSHTDHGYHVARLATDLQTIVSVVILGKNPQTRIYAVGCSIGAAVLWTYIELFGDTDFAGFVFVDQAPLQDRSDLDPWGPGLHHYGCYDEATMLAAQKAWASPDQAIREETYKGLFESCLGYIYKPSPEDNITAEQRFSDQDFFTSISRSCDGVWLAKLLADHTRYDHREAISLITKPILVMAGQRSGCFSLRAQLETVKRATNSKDTDTGEAPGGAVMSEFSSGHWLFWEQPEEFNGELLDWIGRCEFGRGGKRHPYEGQKP